MIIHSPYSIMWLLIVYYLIFIISNFCTATINNERAKNFYRCQNLGDECEKPNDCCSDLICNFVEGMFDI